MKERLKYSIIILCMLCLCNYSSFGQGVKFPLQKGWVNDYEGLFTAQQHDELNSLIADFEQRTNREIALVTLENIKPYTNLNDYSKDLSYNWSLTKEELKNGLIIIVSKSLRTVRITTAYGTHQLIRDDICRNIINNEMLPAYSIGNYYGGTKQGLISLMRQWH